MQTHFPNIIYFLFSGESVCGDKLCQQLFDLFSDPLLPELFPFQILAPNELLDHRNVTKHVCAGRNEEEVEQRMFKSMFDIKLQDGDKLHRIITESTEPVTSGRKRLSDFLCHSINTTESKDSWSFNFKHYGFSTENSSTVWNWFSWIPQRNNLQTERNPHLFLHPWIQRNVSKWRLVHNRRWKARKL